MITQPAATRTYPGSANTDTAGKPQSTVVLLTDNRTANTKPMLRHTQHPMMQYLDHELSTTAGLDPSKITCRSHVKANWICQCCPKGHAHRWQATVNNIYRGTRCSCCSGWKACMCNLLQSMHPKVAAEWDCTRDSETPSNYPAYSNAKVWWYNKQQSVVQATISDRTYKKGQGTSMPR